MMISVLPTIAVIIVIVFFGVIVLILAVSRTKTATSEARLGQYQIVLLPSGETHSGLLTLARGLVNQEKTHFLYHAKKITTEEVEKLDAVLGKKFFYAMKSTGGKLLIVSSENLESEKYSPVIDQTFTFPFGYQTRRLVVADGVTVERAGWNVISIIPRPLDPNLKPETSSDLIELGEVAATITELYIRAKSDMPYEKIAEVRTRQLEEAQTEIADAYAKIDKVRLAAAKKPLLPGAEVPEEEAVQAGGLPLERIIVTAVFGFIMYLFVVPWIIGLVYPPVDPFVPYTAPDPFIPSIVLAFLVFIFYERLKKLVFRIMGRAK